MIKWTREISHHWMSHMFNLALQYGMPHDWSTNWVKPLHKEGNVVSVKKYWTITIRYLMKKLFGCIMD